MDKIIYNEPQSAVSSYRLGNGFIDNDKEKNNDISVDKIKILELNNIIDKWEEEILFSEGGFYSLTGKEAQNKHKEFVNELSEYISSKIEKLGLKNQESKRTAEKIKNDKILAITRKMQAYEQQQLNNWQLDVYDNAIASCIKRAVLYKDDDEITQKSFLNGLSVMNVMAEKDNWNSNTYKANVRKFKSDFYMEIIKSFMESNDINAYKYFIKYKDFLDTEDKENLEKVLKEQKKVIVSYKLAKEIFSYDEDDEKLEKYIKKIDDKEIEVEVRKYIRDFNQAKKKNQDIKEKELQQKDWQKVISLLNDKKDDILVHLDYTLPSKHISDVKNFIVQYKKYGYINTDKKEFITLFKEVFEDYQEFKKKDIFEYRTKLSDEDFTIFEKFQEMENLKYENYHYDYLYCSKFLKELGLGSIEEKYAYIKQIISVFQEYIRNNNKTPDIRERNKLIESINQRYKQNEKPQK